MNQRIRIGTGSRTEGSHGSLISNLDATIKRRIRSKVIGTVVKVAGPHKWNVIFDYNAKVKTIRSRSLKLVETDAGIYLDEECAIDISRNVSIDLFILSYRYCTISLVI